VIVIGDDGYFILDGHHFSIAVYEADIDDDLRYVYATVENNYKSLSTDDFWSKLVDNNYVWLFDQKGFGPISPRIFPTKLDEMLNDPFRALAWMVCDAGGFGKIGAPFEDFVWANFFRSQIPLTSISEAYANNILKESSKNNTVPSYLKSSSFTWCEVDPYSKNCLPDESEALEFALPIAMGLANSSAAELLPGYKQGFIDPPKCGNSEHIITKYINQITHNN